MATNVEVTKNATENALSVLRRFTKRVQGSGVLPRVRSIRYKVRTQSHFKVKRSRLTLNERAETKATLIKLGKLKPEERKTRGRK